MLSVILIQTQQHELQLLMKAYISFSTYILISIE
jgi:hypothetical protein